MPPTRRHPSLEDRCRYILVHHHEDSEIWKIAEGYLEALKRIEELEKDVLFWQRQQNTIVDHSLMGIQKKDNL